jgi:hypothetical protein
MTAEAPNWYCARTKSKHEHIAASNARKNLKLEVFNPGLLLDRAKRRVRTLLDISGGPTSAEVDRAPVVTRKNAMATRIPVLAVTPRTISREIKASQDRVSDDWYWCSQWFVQSATKAPGA